jgi:hypothetical protein
MARKPAALKIKSKNFCGKRFSSDSEIQPEFSDRSDLKNPKASVWRYFMMLRNDDYAT